jgi:hypothetical protein
LLLRRLLLAAGASAALTGVLAGLARVGVPVGWGPSAGAWHGPLLVLGLFATLISLERAVALGATWAMLVPALGAATGTALLLRQPVAPWLAVVCAAGLVAVNVALVRRRPALFGWLTCAGSVMLLVGDLAWAAGRPIPAVTPTWIAFLTLTIVGERVRWSRAGVTPAWALRVLVVLAAALGLTAVAHAAGTDGASRAFGMSLVLTAAWQGRFDVARQAVAQSGSSRYIAVGVLAGMMWLAMAGLLLAWWPMPPAGPRYDAMLHAVLVGYVFSVVFAHAPTMLQAVASVLVPFTVALYAPLAVLHVSLLARIVGDLGDSLLLRRIGSIGNALALALFVAVVIGSRLLVRSRPV